MTNWLAGMLITADRLNDNTLQTSTTSGLTAAAGWSVSSFSGRKINGITTVEMLVNRTGADITELTSTANSGNIPDTDLATLPSGWRPLELINTVYGNGSVDGECTITTAGVITLRTISGAGTGGGTPVGVGSGTNVRVTAMWISENN